MDAIKELLKDPAKLEATLKDTWAKIDAKNEGSVPFDVFRAILEKMAAEKQMAVMLPTTDKGKDEFKKITDPTNSGKVNFDGFKAIVLQGIENMKKEGKL